ncbi:MAG: DUF4157 domain-containing protein [Methanothrix sp.]|nr:DUF4157 domain-containing protein [Methanothrix sp.]
MRGGGQPLSPQARGFFEPRFGHDFGHVRVHADEQAVETARALNAKAYTMGNDIVVGENNQSSKREARDKLLAHELTHVVQQTSRNSGQVALIPIQRQQKGEQVPESSQIKAKEAGDLLDIKEVIKFFKPGGTAIVTDIGAEKSYMAKAISVDTHADIYPISAADTQILKDIYNFKGDFVAWCEQTPHKLWTRRAIIITIDADPIKGRKIAASQHGCPHGFGKSGIKNFEKGMTLKNHHEDNKYPGHFCIHFLHSRKHRPGEEDAVHQQMVYKAAGIEPAKSKKKK